MMRESHTAILAVQEAHLPEEAAAEVSELFKKRLHVVSSQGENPRAAGVAFAFNKERLNLDEVETKEIIPGRALLASVKYYIYAPNDKQENKNFWADLRIHFEQNPADSPQIILGDFNIVEDALDRLPSHEDPENVREEL